MQPTLTQLVSSSEGMIDICMPDKVSINTCSHFLDLADMCVGSGLFMLQLRFV